MRHLPTPPELRGAIWVLRSLRSVRRQLRAHRIEEVTVRPPRWLPPQAHRGVLGALRRRDSSCLERALVLQSWHSSRGRSLELVIGVTGREGFAAHAWLDGEGDSGHERSYREILRLRPLSGDGGGLRALRCTTSGEREEGDHLAEVS